jgi:hypothetical protein
VSVADAVNRAGADAINRVAVERTTRAGADAVTAAVTDAINRASGSTDLVAHEHTLTRTHIPHAHTRTHTPRRARTHMHTRLAIERTPLGRARASMDEQMRRCRTERPQGRRFGGSVGGPNRLVIG